MGTITPINVDEFNRFQTFVVVQDTQPKGQEGHGFVDDQDEVRPINTPLHETTITFDNPFFTSLREDFFRARLGVESSTDNENRYGLNAQDLLITGPIDLARPEVLTHEQIVHDVEYVQYILTHAYIGEYVLHDYVDAAVSALEGLKQIQSMTPEDLDNRISEIFSQIPDGHLSCRVVSASSEEAALPPYELEPSIEIRVRGRKELLQVPVIRIRKMIDDRSEDDPDRESLYRNFLNQARHIIKKAPAVVVDLRHNPGGDGPPKELISLLTNRRLKSEHVWRNNSPAATAMRLSQFALVEQFDGREILPEEYGQRRDEFEKATTSTAVQWSDEFEKVRRGRLRPYGRPIIVVIDSGCASACEGTVGLLRQIPGVQLVGEHSSGCAHYGGNGSFVLPNSKIRVVVGARYAEYLTNPNGDQFPMENVGFQPDVVTGSSDSESFYDDTFRTVGEILTRHFQSEGRNDH